MVERFERCKDEHQTHECEICGLFLWGCHTNIAGIGPTPIVTCVDGVYHKCKVCGQKLFCQGAERSKVDANGNESREQINGVNMQQVHLGGKRKSKKGTKKGSRKGSRKLDGGAKRKSKKGSRKGLRK